MQVVGESSYQGQPVCCRYIQGNANDLLGDRLKSLLETFFYDAMLLLLLLRSKGSTIVIPEQGP